MEIRFAEKKDRLEVLQLYYEHRKDVARLFNRAIIIKDFFNGKKNIELVIACNKEGKVVGCASMVYKGKTVHGGSGLVHKDYRRRGVLADIRKFVRNRYIEKGMERIVRTHMTWASDHINYKALEEEGWKVVRDNEMIKIEIRVSELIKNRKY